MLNKVGLTIHWDTLMNFFDEQLKKQDLITSQTPAELPLLLLMDNINICTGNKRHYRLFQKYGEHMWNFTGRGLLIPRLDTWADTVLGTCLRYKIYDILELLMRCSFTVKL